MITRIIKITEMNFDIYVEVNRQADVVKAEMMAVHMEETPIDCTEAVKSSNYYSKLVASEFSEIDWDDHGDDDFSMETIKEARLA